MLEQITSIPYTEYMPEQNSEIKEPTILIVDDTQEIRDVIKMACLNKKLTTDEAVDGRDAVEKILKNHYPVVITDIKMPRMDGLELTRWIKEYNKDIFVVVMTGYADQYLWDEIVAAGADDFLTKPFNVVQMIIKIKTILRYIALLQTSENELKEILAISNEMIDGLQSEAMEASQHAKKLQVEIETLRKKIFSPDDTSSG